MDKYRAIPQGYMTVGEVAKKMGVTVRTMQYYDKEGILSPSSESEGGLRLYAHKDIVKLYQIQSMKYLGFSLKDIKTMLPSINTPEEVSNVLAEQAKGIREKVKSLTEVLDSIEKFSTEVSQMETVDWERYADIIFILQAKNDAYWVLKYLDKKIYSRMSRNYDKKDSEDEINILTELIDRAAMLQKSKLAPESKEVQALAKDWWDYMIDVTGGDISLMPELIEMGKQISDDEWNDKFSFSGDFLGEALKLYCKNMGNDNPFKEAEA